MVTTRLMTLAVRAAAKAIEGGIQIDGGGLMRLRDEVNTELLTTDTELSATDVADATDFALAFTSLAVAINRTMAPIGAGG